jgi:hypothetical protein
MWSLIERHKLQTCASAGIKSKQGRTMKSKRQSTVEPVFGTLTQFMGLRKVNTKGIRQAQKVMLLSAVAYNVKKYLKFTQKLAQSGVGTAHTLLNDLIAPFQLLLLGYKPVKI